MKGGLANWTVKHQSKICLRSLKIRTTDNCEAHQETEWNFAWRGDNSRHQCRLRSNWAALTPAKRTWRLKWVSASVWLNEHGTRKIKEIFYSELMRLCLKCHTSFRPLNSREMRKHSPLKSYLDDRACSIQPARRGWGSWPHLDGERGR